MFQEAFSPQSHDAGAAALRVAFCETCEQLIYTRSLLEDPRHQTRRQGSAVARLLREALGGIERRMDAVRSEVYGPGPVNPAAAAAGIGMAIAALRQVLGYVDLLGTRWPLGTADLFVRKLVAEGIPLPVPTLCAVNRAENAGDEIGESVRQHLAAVGLHTPARAGARPIVSIQTGDLANPLAWPALLYPLAAATVAGRRLDAQLRRPSQFDASTYRRLCTAVVAGRLIGEVTFAALAAKALLNRLSGGTEVRDLDLLATASRRFARPLTTERAETVAGFYAAVLQAQQAIGGSWGLPSPLSTQDIPATAWDDAEAFVQTEIPAPTTATAGELDALVASLDDGRPINARPIAVHADFAARLEACTNANDLYSVLDQVGEQPCSMATILAAGWRYKIVRSYPRCDELMSGSETWRDALDSLTAHVQDRCALLQQSIEAAYVQQVFARGRDA